MSYDASDITVLEGLDAVRKRPGMYIGSTGERGLHHLVYEVVDNSVDEALAGYCDTIEGPCCPAGGAGGRQRPRDPGGYAPGGKKPAVEVVLTVLSAGGKFGGSGYAVSRGTARCRRLGGQRLSTTLDVAFSVRRLRCGRREYDHGVPRNPPAKG